MTTRGDSVLQLQLVMCMLYPIHMDSGCTPCCCSVEPWQKPTCVPYTCREGQGMDQFCGTRLQEFPAGRLRLRLMRWGHQCTLVVYMGKIPCIVQTQSPEDIYAAHD